MRKVLAFIVALGAVGAAAAEARAESAEFRCAVQYGVLAEVVDMAKAGKAPYAAIAFPANAATLPLRERSSQVEKKAIAGEASITAQNAISIDIMDRIDTVAERIGGDVGIAQSVFERVRGCDRAHGFVPPLGETPPPPKPVAAPAAAPPAGWGKVETLNCAINYYAMGNLVRRPDLIQRTNEAMRRYATPLGLAAPGVQATVVEKARVRAKAPADQIWTSIKACDADLALPPTLQP